MSAQQALPRVLAMSLALLLVPAFAAPGESGGTPAKAGTTPPVGLPISVTHAVPPREQPEPPGRTAPAPRPEIGSLANGEVGGAGAPVPTSFVISGAVENEVEPAIAYNSQRRQYLVVWYNDRPGCDDIRAQRLSFNGTLLGGPFYISAGCPFDRRHPDVTYNSASDQYLVVWEQYDPAAGYSIQGRRLGGTGQLLDANDIPIRSSGYNLYTPVTPAVAYAYSSNRYLVVWAETWHPLPIQYDIFGQVMTAAGSMDGGPFTIAHNTKPLEKPDLAYNRHANRYLVAWQLDAGALYDIHGRQVHGGGGLFQGDITIAYYTKSSTAPSVAAIPTTPTTSKFLVIWEVMYVPPNDRDIYGRLVAEDGTPGSDFWISWANAQDESSPAVAATESNLQYFSVWRHPRGVVDKPIIGRAISYAGALLGQAADFGGVNANYPAVAAGPSGDFLVAWQDQSWMATNTNLYGQLWGHRTYLPAVRR